MNLDCHLDFRPGLMIMRMASDGENEESAELSPKTIRSYTDVMPIAMLLDALLVDVATLHKFSQIKLAGILLLLLQVYLWAQQTALPFLSVIVPFAQGGKFGYWYNSDCQ